LSLDLLFAKDAEVAMTDEAKRWWEVHAREYQEMCRIPVDILYGAGSPNEEQLQLIGPVKGKRVLEIGCGGAQCSIAFARQGAIVTAVDIAEAEIEFARELAAKNDVGIELYRLDMTDLSPVANGSQDIVFSASAFGYVDDLAKCFSEVRRVLKDGGLFVWAMGHPFYLLSEETLRPKHSYFETGKFVEGQETGCAFAHNRRTVSDYFNMMVEAGFNVERIIEPDSRERYPCDPWYGLWNYTPELLRLLPPTIIFKGRKR
jgi:ubiquinone/menaquinone biosynthesis C-methylase UbiE